MGRRRRRPRWRPVAAKAAAPPAGLTAAPPPRLPPAPCACEGRPSLGAREERPARAPAAAAGDRRAGARVLSAAARWLCRPSRRRCADGDACVDGQAMLRCLLCMATTSSALEVPDWGAALEAALGQRHARAVAAEVGGAPHWHRVCRWEASVCTRAYRTAAPGDWNAGGGLERGGEALWQLPEVPPDGVRVTLQLLGVESAKRCIGAGPAAAVQAQRLGGPAAPGGAAGVGAAYRLQAFWDIQPHGERRRELVQQELPAPSLAPGTYALQLTSHNSRAAFSARPVFGPSFRATGSK